VGPLYQELHHVFDADYPPSPIHELLASLPGRLKLSESAWLALAAGEPEVGERQLQRAGRTGRGYQRAARQSGFHDCADVLPASP
jgi:hypothetical protein